MKYRNQPEEYYNDDIFKGKIINLPNSVTALRLLLTPFFYFAIIQRTDFAFILFLIISISDTLDGLIARKFNQETKFGKLFDAITDSIFLLVSFIALINLGRIRTLYCLLLFLPKSYFFLHQIVVKLNKQKISYDTSIFRKMAAFFSYSLILLSLLKEHIHKETLIVVILNIILFLVEIFYRRKVHFQSKNFTSSRY